MLATNPAMHALLLSAAVKLVAVHLLSQTAGASSATPDMKRTRVEQPVTLVVAIEATVDGQPAIFAGTKKVDFGDGAGARAAKPWPAGVPLDVAWLKIEPTAGSADNAKGGFHWDVIPYAETPWARNDGDNADPLARTADVHTTVLADRGGLGTMAFAVRITAGGTVLATPGRESTWHGGLSTKVARVSYRRDDTFLGYLTELYNTPYIWASAGVGADHQAEHLIGSDCADFMCYGLRRTGRKIEYGYTGDVPAWGGKKSIASIATRGADGRFLDARGNVIPVGDGGVKPGDLLLFKGHVGAFLRDRDPIGVLDAGDFLVHTAWAPPSEDSFDDAKPWTQPPFTVWRVK